LCSLCVCLCFVWRIGGLGLSWLCHCDWHVIEITILCIIVIIHCRSLSHDIIVGLRHHCALSHIIICRHVCRRASSSYVISARLVTRCRVDVALRHALGLLRVIVVAYCCYMLSSSSGKADHCFL